MPTSKSGFVAATSFLLVFGLSGCGGSTSGDGGATGGATTGGSGGSPGGSGGSGGSTGGSAGCGGYRGCGCMYNGKLYAPGETFGDGCNTCTCDSNSNVTCTALPCPLEGCDYNGTHYPVGASFPAGDGCNTCSCEQGGKVACTLMFCAITCSYGGKTYSMGQQFPALDGCNTCTCTDQGVACTEMACACNPATEWWRSYISTDPAKCQVIDYACITNTTPFQSACGCGCEQDPSCPEYFDCMPPSPCNPDEIKIKCPYSKIAY